MVKRHNQNLDFQAHAQPKVSQSLQLGQTGANLFLAFSLLAKAGNFLAKEITNPKEVPSPHPYVQGFLRGL